MTTVKEVVDGITQLVMIPIDVFVRVVNDIGVQRIGAVLTLFGYVYMSVMGMSIAEEYTMLMMVLNGLHAGKSIYAKGVKTK